MQDAVQRQTAGVMVWHNPFSNNRQVALITRQRVGHRSARDYSLKFESVGNNNAETA
jgi:hypothetical protein